MKKTFLGLMLLATGCSASVFGVKQEEKSVAWKLGNKKLFECAYLTGVNLSPYTENKKDTTEDTMCWCHLGPSYRQMGTIHMAFILVDKKMCEKNKEGNKINLQISDE